MYIYISLYTAVCLLLHVLNRSLYMDMERYLDRYTDGLKLRMTFWWKDVDVKKNTRVPREKFGRHSNPIYLVLKPLNKSGTAF